jgi:hypothetical protein
VNLTPHGSGKTDQSQRPPQLAWRLEGAARPVVARKSMARMVSCMVVGEFAVTVRLVGDGQSRRWRYLAKGGILYPWE